jgi:hypothetical protein
VNRLSYHCKTFFGSKYFFSILFYFFIFIAKAEDSLVVIKGKVTQEVFTGFTDMLVVNMTKGTGVYGNLDGSFEITVKQHDVIKISCRGYTTATISMKDSVYKKEYFVFVKLKFLEIIQENPVIIRPQPTIEDLKTSQNNIGSYQYKPLVNNALDMFMSPLTAIYQMFSKREAEKQKYAMFMSQKEIDDYVTNVSRYLSKSGVIDLTEEEMPYFVARCPINEDFAKEASLYDVSIVIKSCYEEYAKRYKIERY